MGDVATEVGSLAGSFGDGGTLTTGPYGAVRPAFLAVLFFFIFVLVALAAAFCYAWRKQQLRGVAAVLVTLKLLICSPLILLSWLVAAVCWLAWLLVLPFALFIPSCGCATAFKEWLEREPSQVPRLLVEGLLSEPAYP